MADRTCWCGNTELVAYSDHYRWCQQCGTLVSTVAHSADVSRVSADDSDLYGRDYWFGHMENDLGFANIYQRARADMVERIPHWLRAVLACKVPPARVLELGSAHGGFVAALRWSGFDATGLELSPAIAQIARDLFDVPMLQGPLEDQPLAAGGTDLIAMMDVLEHLPRPVETMRRAIECLATDGLLLIQTPCFPEVPFDEILNSGHRFIEQLKQDEHLFLFSQRSATRFFRELGCEAITFETALFAHYDMFFTVSRHPLPKIAQADQDAALLRAGTGRAVLAILDLHTRERLLAAQFAAADRDRVERLKAVEELSERLAESERDRANRLAAIQKLSSQLVESETDRAARLVMIEQVRRRLQEAEAKIRKIFANGSRKQPPGE